MYFHNLHGQSSAIIKTEFLKYIVSLIFRKKQLLLNIFQKTQKLGSQLNYIRPSMILTHHFGWLFYNFSVLSNDSQFLTCKKQEKTLNVNKVLMEAFKTSPHISCQRATPISFPPQSMKYRRTDIHSLNKFIFLVATLKMTALKMSQVPETPS